MRRLLVLAVAACLLGFAAYARPATVSPRLLLAITPFAHGNLSMRSEVVVVGRTGRVLRVVAPPGSAYAWSAKWSPDGSKLAWDARDGIHVENAGGGDARLLVHASAACQGVCAALEFVWSPDSSALDVGGEGPQTNELLRVPLDGSPPRTLAPALTDSSYSPDFWTTDGGSLVYVASIGTVGSPHCCHVDVRVLTPGTGRTRTIYRTPNTQAQLPIYSPDLRYRAVITEAGIGQQLRIVGNGTGRSRLVEGVNPTTFVAWSPDSRTFAVVEHGWHVVTVAAATGRVRPIGPGLNVHWSRGGELLVVRGAYDQIWSSTGGRPERELFTTPHAQYVNSVDGD